jgi:hypothetical protein
MSLVELSSIEGARDEVCRADRKVLGATEASNNSRFVYLVFHFLITSADKLTHRQEKIHRYQNGRKLICYSNAISDEKFDSIAEGFALKRP